MAKVRRKLRQLSSKKGIKSQSLTDAMEVFVLFLLYFLSFLTCYLVSIVTISLLMIADSEFLKVLMLMGVQEKSQTLDRPSPFFFGTSDKTGLLQF